MKYTNNIHSNVSIILIVVTFFSLTINAQEDYNTVTDIEGNRYRVSLFGNQLWMSEDLKTTKLTDGEKILNITDSIEWVQTSEPAYSWYDNEKSNKNIYGGLYNWHAVNTGKLCPEGWRVPTNDDWATLIDFFGGSDAVVEKMQKAGFMVVPGGYRYGYYWGSGIFHEVGTNGYWWSSTRATDTHVWNFTISIKNKKIYRSYFTDNNGFSVRCLKFD